MGKGSVTRAEVMTWPLRKFRSLSTEQKLVVWKALLAKTEPDKAEIKVSELPSKSEIESRLRSLLTKSNINYDDN